VKNHTSNKLLEQSIPKC